MKKSDEKFLVFPLGQVGKFPLIQTDKVSLTLQLSVLRSCGFHTDPMSFHLLPATCWNHLGATNFGDDQNHHDVKYPTQLQIYTWNLSKTFTRVNIQWAQRWSKICITLKHCTNECSTNQGSIAKQSYSYESLGPLRAIIHLFFHQNSAFSVISQVLINHHNIKQNPCCAKCKDNKRKSILMRPIIMLQCRIPENSFNYFSFAHLPPVVCLGLGFRGFGCFH